MSVKDIFDRVAAASSDAASAVRAATGPLAAAGAQLLAGGPATSPPQPASAQSTAPAAAIPPEEAELVARARDGDQQAFATLVRTHQRQVYTLALQMLHDEEDAVEATQEAFLAAWQHLRGFRGEARLATWLYRITYHHCLKVVERRRRELQTHAELASETSQAERPAVRLSQQHAQAAIRDLCDVVRDEIAKLPPKYETVLDLRHLQDLSYEEIAEVLRVPIGTVKTHLFRARALLKARLTELAGELDRATAEGMVRASELSAGLRDLIGRRLEPLRKETGG